MKVLTKQRFKLAMLCLMQIVIVIAPVIGLIVYKRNEYFASSEKVYSLSIAAVISITFIILQVLGKTPKNVHKIIKLAVLSLFLWVLRPILYDLCLIVTAGFVGELLGFLIFSHLIRIQKLKIASLETSEITGELKEKNENEVEWSGRV